MLNIVNVCYCSIVEGQTFKDVSIKKVNISARHVASVTIQIFFFLFNLLHSIQKIFIIWQVLNDGYLQQQSGWSCDFNMAVPMSRASRIFPKRRMKAQDIITFSLTCAYVIGSIFMYYIKFGLVG